MTATPLLPGAICTSTPILNPVACCAVCLRSFPIDSLDECRCGELLCGESSCHAYACACTDDSPDAQLLRTALREAIRERFQLISGKKIVGGNFPIDLETRLVELTNLQAILRAELEMIHVLEDGMVA